MSVNCDLSANKLPALKQLLENRLQAAIKLHGTTSQTLASGASEVFLEAIPLLRAKDPTSVLYLCPIGLKLAKIWQMSAMDIATEIAAHLSQIVAADADTLDFTVQAVPPGWIHLQLSDFGLANWLQCLTQFPPEEYLLEREGLLEQPASLILSRAGSGEAEEKGLSAADTSQKAFHASKNLFLAQYAHARCCSLLRMAHREGTIILSDPAPEVCSPFWHILAPNPIPWLNSEVSPSLPQDSLQSEVSSYLTQNSKLKPQTLNLKPQTSNLKPQNSKLKTQNSKLLKPQNSKLKTQNSLHLLHPAERRLIFQLVDTLDALSQPPATHRLTEWLKLATALTTAFESFYSACRLWGEVKTEAPQLVQARLGLIKATQSILRLMLQDLFSVCAPVEL